MSEQVWAIEGEVHIKPTRMAVNIAATYGDPPPVLLLGLSSKGSVIVGGFMAFYEWRHHYVTLRKVG